MAKLGQIVKTEQHRGEGEDLEGTSGPTPGIATA